MCLSREFARDVMPTDGPGEVAVFAALTVSLYMISHQPPNITRQGERRAVDPLEFQVGLLQDQDGTADSLGQVLRARRRWQRALGGATQVSGLLDVLTPALLLQRSWSRGGERWAAKARKLSRQRCLAHTGSWHCPLPWPHLGKPACGPGSGEGKWGPGLHTSMHPHFVSSS